MSTAFPRPRWYHVGPHGFFDLVRLARSGRSAGVRVAYILVLFAALAISFYSSAPPNSREREASINWNARIAERFCATILVMQNIAVLVLTPIYMAASIQEERDKRTFPLLFTTQLTAREIVLGKWLSRCMQVGMVLLAGLPVLALAQLWGGIDMPMIAANFLHTAMLLLAVGAFSMMLALQQTSFMATLVRAYVFPIAFFVPWACPLMCCMQSPIPMLAPIGSGPHSYTWMWTLIAFLTAVYVSLTLGFLHSATILLNDERQDDTPRVQVEPAITNRRNRFWRWPALPEGVVAWKECYLDRGIWHVMPYAVLIVLCGPLFAHVCILIAGRVPREGVQDESQVISLAFMLASFGVYVLLVSVRVAGCIVRERQQRTLETLLTLPIAPRRFLYQKLVGNLQRHWTWLLPAGAAWLIWLLFGQGNLLVGLALPIVLAVHLAFFVVLGLYLSVVSRSTLSAHATLGVILALLLFGLPVFASFVDFSPTVRALLRGLNPVACWVMIATEMWRSDGASVAPLVIASVLPYAAAALILWELACRRFLRDPMG